jgi:hypothetical protein
MKFIATILLSLLALQAETPAATPSSAAETLRYNVNWPSGLSLGEGTLAAQPVQDGQKFTFQVSAALPGFALEESAVSRVSNSFCSLALQKNGTRGRRKIEETTAFDTQKLTALRQTKGGGKTEGKTASCAKDALAFLYFLRKELAAGRLPAAQQVYYGAAYQIHSRYAGTQAVKVAGETVETERVETTIKGPASEFTVTFSFARDAARTPLLVELPLSMGKFSMEIAR